MAKKKKGQRYEDDDDDEPYTPFREKEPEKKSKKRKEDYYPEDDDDDYVPETSAKIAPKIFTTREIGRRYLDREGYLKLCIREMLIYFIFLIVLGFLASGHHSSEDIYLSRTMARLFTETQFRCPERNEVITYNEISSVEHIWSYLQHYILNTYSMYWYSHQSVSVPTEEDIKDFILFENKIIGRPRIRMVRVKKDSCTIPEEVKSLVSTCYAPYSSSAEDKEDFGPTDSNVTKSFKYRSASELGSLPVSGEVSTYGGGGYYLDFTLSMKDTNDSVRELQAETWLDRNTRAVIVQFSTYSINENIFFTLTLLWEMPATGGVIPSYIIYIHKFLQRDLSDWFLLILLIVFVVFILWFTIEELYEISYFKLHYFDYFWNFLDFLILIFAYLTIGAFVYQFLVLQTQLPDLVKKVDEFACFDKVNSARETFVTLLVILFFFAAIKAVKYLNFNHPMHQMQTTLDRAAKDITCFSIIFFIVFMTFSQLGHLLFGSQVRDFRTFVDSVFALLRTAVGDFDYQKIEKVNNFLGPIYFFAYIFFIYFILVNMFLAIIIDTYSEVRTNIRDHAKETYVFDIIGRFFRKILGLCGMKTMAGKEEPPPHKSAGEVGAYDDIQRLLRRCGFNDMEIDLFFDKFDIPKEKPISQGEMRQKLMQKFDIQETEVLKVVEKEKDELGDKLMQRIKNLEENITDVNYKIDLIDNKIDSIQQIRARKRDTIK